MSKKAKYNLAKIVVALCVVLCVVLTAFELGVTYRVLKAAEVDGTEYSVAEYNWLYTNSVYEIYNNYYSQYGQLATYFFNPSSNLSEQVYNQETGETWADYVKTYTDNTLIEMTKLYDAGKAAGYEMEEIHYETIENEWNGVKEAAAENGLSANGYAEMNYGRGVNEKVFREMEERYFYAFSFASNFAENEEVSASDVDAYYAENEQYIYMKNTLASLLVNESESVKMITDYVSEDKASQTASVGCPFSAEKIAALSDEEFLRLSEPVRYEIEFKTETYRSGKKHIKKTRYKENPFGKIVGKHDGAQFYTIGQRKGLNIGGHKDSIFVIETDIPKNIIYVGEGHTHKGLSRSCLRVAPSEIHWIRRDLAMAPGDIRRYRVRIRYRQPLQDATVIMRENGMYILFDTPQRGITPGQFAVWYDGEEMVGSGVI